MNYHLYDKLQAEHRQELQNEVARNRLLAHSSRSRHHSIGRRAISKLGAALVAIGLKLERFDQSSQPYPSLSSPVQR